MMKSSSAWVNLKWTLHRACQNDRWIFVVLSKIALAGNHYKFFLHYAVNARRILAEDSPDNDSCIAIPNFSQQGSLKSYL
jgi:hypothetical protein